MSGKRRLIIRPWFVGVLVIGLVAVAAGLYWFQPWKLWVDKTVQEDVPAVSAPLTSTLATSVPPADPQELVNGQFISHEHSTTGFVRILRSADGSLVLRLENLATSNGPDLHVWLTDAPVLPGEDGWGVFDNGKYLSAGKLKGNRGSHNYPLSADIDLTAYTSVSIWCDRFNVSFGAAELTKTVA